MTRDRGGLPGSPPADRHSLFAQLWPTLAAPIATEIGAIAALPFPVYAALGVALLALAALALALPAIRPGEGVVRAAVLVAGPPLRYLLLLLAAWRTWVDPAQGLIPALVLVLGLAFAIPLLGFLIAQARARRG